MAESEGEQGGGNGGGGRFSLFLRELKRSLGLGPDPNAELSEDLAEALEERREAQLPFEPQERRMLMNIIRFGELKVDDVMVPRADIIAIEAATPLPEVIEAVREAGHSRLPVFRGTLDDVIGMLHVKDLFRYWGSESGFSLAPIVRKVLFVPPSMPLLDLLLQMQATRIHMALVVDEYGGIDGLATIEDLMEQIVGEIEDEHDIDEQEPVTLRADGLFEADGRAPLELLEEKLGLTLIDDEEREEIETLAGLIYALIGRLPVRGELIRHPAGVEFEVTDADPRRVKRVRIRRLRQDEVEAG
ncbi:MAG: HlyC/CorC family transporter [Alphaproteobacteria bacterium]|nr:HlyC/CorC family transporter [Alphaproteobacteria bacterium]